MKKSHAKRTPAKKALRSTTEKPADKTIMLQAVTVHRFMPYSVFRKKLDQAQAENTKRLKNGKIQESGKPLHLVLAEATRIEPTTALIPQGLEFGGIVIFSESEAKIRKMFHTGKAISQSKWHNVLRKLGFGKALKSGRKKA